jgi:hypothetical protein
LVLEAGWKSWASLRAKIWAPSSEVTMMPQWSRATAGSARRVEI